MDKKIVAGILAHVDSGKTTLSESLLYKTGVVKKLGRVDQKDTFLDTDTVEKERGITIYSKDARMPLGDRQLIMIDTPGHVDFSTEMERVLSVLDVAILLVSGSSGIQSHTKTLWNLLKSYQIPTFIFVNKMDMEGVDKDKLLASIKKDLSDNAVDFNNYINDREIFYEDIATCDEKLFGAYFENGYIDNNDIIKKIDNRDIFPVLFGSALKMLKIDELIEVLSTFIPNPSYNEKNEFGGIVYKITRDSNGKRLTHLKVLSGSLKVKDLLGEEKVNEIRTYSGDRYTAVTEVFAGDICAIAGLNETKNLDTFGAVKKSIPPILAPALSYAIHYPDDIDAPSMLKMLRQLEEEDPSLNVEYKEQTKEIFVSLMGDVQTEVLMRTINDRYDIAVTFTDGKICYKETIDHVVEGVGHFEPLRHYAEVHIKIEPLETGSGIEYEADISEDLLAKNWQRLILTHLMEKEHKGVLLRAPLTDVKLSLVSGRAHLKHTEGGDFRQATYRAIRQGLMELTTIGAVRLLEPFYDYSLTLPDEYVGRAMTDINKMSGTANISETDHEHHITVLTGRAPVSTMNGYSKEVISYTKGLGQLSLSLSGYDKCHNEDEVLASSHYNPDNDMYNPSSSVFCSHGAGTVIPWYEVPEHMHLSYASDQGAFGEGDDTFVINRLDDDMLKEANDANRLRRMRDNNSSKDIAISIEEIDQILHQSTHSNEKGRQGSYKGISADLRLRKRYEATNKSSDSNKETVYKGTKSKTKYMLVDGYNVIHAWDELQNISTASLDGAAGALNDILCNYQAIMDINLMVVYDAYKVKGHAVEENKYKNITVVYTKEAQTADQYIEHYAHENSKKYDITVVTSDGLEQIIVIGNGCQIISSREFKEITDRTFKEFNNRFNVGEE